MTQNFDRAPIQDTGQRLNMSAVGRAALAGAFVVPYSSDQGNSDPALDPGVPADGTVVAYKDTATTIKLCFYRRGVGWVKVQLT